MRALLAVAALFLLVGSGTADADACDDPDSGTYCVQKVPDSIRDQPVDPPKEFEPSGPTIEMPAQPRRRSTSTQRVQPPRIRPAPSVSSPPRPAPAVSSQPPRTPSAAEEIAIDRLGLEGAQKYVDGLATAIQGNGSWVFDGAIRREAGVNRPFVQNLFCIFEDCPVVNGQTTGSVRPIDAETSKAIEKTYDGVPGGVVLEGAARFAPISDLTYDAQFNALILNDTLVYFILAHPQSVAVMAHALADNPKVGVSLGDPHKVYGEVPKDSILALDLKIADNFLGEIVFADRHWTRGYRFPQGFRPEVHTGEFRNLAVFFRLNGFEFEVNTNEIQVSRSNLDIRLIPIQDQPSENGDLLPDDAAIARGYFGPEAYRANTQHIADNIAYYRRERIINQAFEYGALTAFLRGLEQQGFDLHGLAQFIETSISRL